MIFFLLFSFFFTIRGDCLEFTNTSLINKCLIVDSEPPDWDTEHYYPQCLLCTIETLIKPANIQFEQENQCLTIELQCIQLKFPSIKIFENFFRFHQAYLDDLFHTDNGTDQNTLHVIIKNNTLHEINADYIKEIFQYRTYRALFFELHIQNEIIRINRNLIDLTRLSIKLILVCGDKISRRQTIYIFHDRKITRESKHDPCTPIFIPSTTMIISTTVIASTPLAISKEKSKTIVLIIILLTAFLLSLGITLMIYCLKRIRHRYRRVSKNSETTSEVSISQDETPLTPNETPKLSLKLKRPLRGMRALQLLDDDV